MEDIRQVQYRRMALLTTGFLLCDFIAVIVLYLIFGTRNYATEAPWYSLLIGFPITIVIWSIGNLYSFNWIKKNNAFDELFTFKIDKKTLIYSIIYLLLIAVYEVISVEIFLGEKIRFFPQAYREFLAYRKLFGDKAIPLFILQYIYYLLEFGIVTQIIAFSHNALSLRFKNKKLPYGAFALMLLWGLLHIISQGWFFGIYITIFSFFIALPYTISKKNIFITYMSVLIFFVF